MSDIPIEGVPASPSGYSAEPEPCSTVSAVPVSIPNATDGRPGVCEFCGNSGIGGYEKGPEFCACRYGFAALAKWQAERKAKATWHVSTNTDVILLGGTISTRDEAAKAAAAILAMAASIPASAIEARRAATGNTDAVHESAAPQEDAHNDGA